MSARWSSAAAEALAIADLGLRAAFSISVGGAAIFPVVPGRWSATDGRAAPSRAHGMREIGDAAA